jgi:hypothetical protein
MRFAALLLGALTAGCSTVAPMARMEPLPASEQDVQFKNGTPIVFSPGERFDVAISPKGGPTGRHNLEPRLEFMVGIHNRSGQRVEVSERNISASTTPIERVSLGDAGPARVVKATEIEDAIVSNASWAQAMNAFDGAMQYAAARNAGTTTYSGTAYQTATVRQVGQLPHTEIEGQSTFQGQSYNEGAAMQAQRQARADTAAKAQAIQAHARTDLERVATVFQRNTIEPGESYIGAVVLELDRDTACHVMRYRGGAGVSAYQAPGPCKIHVTVNVEGEAHTFDFNEVESN